jgi:hypothetical protein
MSGAHLSTSSIERYVARRAPVDEILAAAEHLDVCFECRDRAAALVDDGSMEIPHVRKRMASFVAAQAKHSATPWVVAAIAILTAIALFLLFQK